MNKSFSVAVYCASSAGLADHHYQDARRVGEGLAERGWPLVYGGGKAGMMGALADATRAKGGRVIGVIPDFMVERELANTAADELIITSSMRDRRREMENRADAFVALPGGFGTLEELIEIMVGRMLNRHDKTLVLLNRHGFYDALIRFFDGLVQQGFKPGGWRGVVHIVPDVDSIWPYLERKPPMADGFNHLDPLWR